MQFLRLPENSDQKLSLAAENVLTLYRWLQHLTPHLVIMPHPNDSNVTHQRVAMLYQRSVLHHAELLATSRSQQKNGPDSVAETAVEINPLVMFNRDAKTRAMQDNFVTPFEQPAADAKARLLRLHESQQQRNLEQRNIGFDERVLTMNRALAERLGTASRYAESFDLAVASLNSQQLRRNPR